MTGEWREGLRPGSISGKAAMPLGERCGEEE